MQAPEASKMPKKRDERAESSRVDCRRIRNPRHAVFHPAGCRPAVSASRGFELDGTSSRAVLASLGTLKRQSPLPVTIPLLYKCILCLVISATEGLIT